MGNRRALLMGGISALIGGGSLMAMKSDDMAGLFAAPPLGPSQAVSYRQGVILSFDQITLENVVSVGGTQMANLPLLGVGESTLLVPGSVVGILVVGSGGATTYSILGRLVTPGTGDAANAVSLESSRTAAVTVDAVEDRVTTTYGDLTTAGPSVTVTVGPSKRLLINVSFGLSWSGSSGGGSASVALSGANSLDPNNDPVPLVSGFSLSGIEAQNPSYTWVQEVANTGATTVTMKYANLIVGSTATFGPRTLVVQAL